MVQGVRSPSVGASRDGLAAAGDGAALLFAEISTERVNEAREQVPYLRERRPELYREWEGSGPKG